MKNKKIEIDIEKNWIEFNNQDIEIIKNIWEIALASQIIKVNPILWIIWSALYFWYIKK